MKNKREKDYLVRRILDKIESSSVDWRENASGNRRILTGQENQNSWRKPGCWNSAD